jgi:hypothetical protein
MEEEGQALGEGNPEGGMEPMDGEGATDAPEETSGEGQQGAADPLYVQKRLKQQKRKHEREMRELHARMADMQARMQQQGSYAQRDTGHMQQPQGLDDQIHKAVTFALNHREMEERKAKEQEQAAHLQRRYAKLQDHLDSMGDKYDDFHDVVMSDEAHFTPTMRDYAMTLPRSGSGSAGEVLYSLGKNPEELKRIARLHPLEQAEEMMKLSHALAGGAGAKAAAPKHMGAVRNNPAIGTGAAVTDRTPIGNIRARMRAGTWK